MSSASRLRRAWRALLGQDESPPEPTYYWTSEPVTRHPKIGKTVSMSVPIVSIEGAYGELFIRDVEERKKLARQLVGTCGLYGTGWNGATLGPCLMPPKHPGNVHEDHDGAQWTYGSSRSAERYLEAERLEVGWFTGPDGRRRHGVRPRGATDFVPDQRIIHDHTHEGGGRLCAAVLPDKQVCGQPRHFHELAEEPAKRCVCGAPVEWMDDVRDPGWVHSPGSDTTCTNARLPESEHLRAGSTAYTQELREEFRQVFRATDGRLPDWIYKGAGASDALLDELLALPTLVQLRKEHTAFANVVGRSHGYLLPEDIADAVSKVLDKEQR